MRTVFSNPSLASENFPSSTQPPVELDKRCEPVECIRASAFPAREGRRLVGRAQREGAAGERRGGPPLRPLRLRLEGCPPPAARRAGAREDPTAALRESPA